MGVIWTIIVGFFAGLIARILVPGRNEPRGFILTTILGVVGALVATWLGQALGILNPAQPASPFIGGIIGAVIILVIWGLVARRR